MSLPRLWQSSILIFDQIFASGSDLCLCMGTEVPRPDHSEASRTAKRGIPGILRNQGVLVRL